MADKRSFYTARVVHYYNKLFSFPKYWKLLVLIFLISLSGSILAFSIVNRSFQSILDGSIFAIQVYFIPTVIFDILSSKTFKADVVFNLKRKTALSLVLSLIWMVLLIIGSLIETILPFSRTLYYTTFFNICLTTTIRFLALSTLTQFPRFKLIYSTFTQPLILFISNVFFWKVLSLRIIMASLLSSIVLITATKFFTFIIDRQGESILGIGAITLFKGFIANWLGGSTYSLEKYFEELGRDTDVTVNIFRFRNEKNIKAILTVPNIHPGPFRNLGSSNLPSTLQNVLDAKFSTITAVPHGLSGHELDLTSKSQCNKVIEKILMDEPSNFVSFASKAIRIEIGSAKALCQFLGETALVILTFAPKSTEDLPLEISKEILSKSKSLGIEDVVIIDAHNSIGNEDVVPTLSKKDLEELVLATEYALKTAIKEKKHPFCVGVSKVVPEEFTLEQGIGPGGIVALIIFVDGQKTLYLTIDGNNMVSGLREKIMHNLSDYFDVCEVLTTDTHSVNAVSTTFKRGYSPVGNAIDNEKLISFIKKIAISASDNIADVDVAFSQININNVRVIGEEKFVSMSMLIDLSISLMKRMVPFIYIPAFICAILSFYFIL